MYESHRSISHKPRQRKKQSVTYSLENTVYPITAFGWIAFVEGVATSWYWGSPISTMANILMCFCFVLPNSKWILFSVSIWPPPAPLSLYFLIPTWNQLQSLDFKNQVLPTPVRPPVSSHLWGEDLDGYLRCWWVSHIRVQRSYCSYHSRSTASAVAAPKAAD